MCANSKPVCAGDQDARISAHPACVPDPLRELPAHAGRFPAHTVCFPAQPQEIESRAGRILDPPDSAAAQRTS